MGVLSTLPRLSEFEFSWIHDDARLEELNNKAAKAEIDPLRVRIGVEGFAAGGNQQEEAGSTRISLDTRLWEPGFAVGRGGVVNAKRQLTSDARSQPS